MTTMIDEIRLLRPGKPRTLLASASGSSTAWSRRGLQPVRLLPGGNRRFYDCQVQRKGALGDQPLLHAWYVYWAPEPFHGCVYVSSSGPVVGPSCDLTESVLTVHD